MRFSALIISSCLIKLISSYPHHDGTGPWHRGGFLVSHRRSKIDLKICLHNRYAHALRLDLHDQDAVDLVVVGNFNVVALGQSRKVAKCILQTIMEPKKEREKKKRPCGGLLLSA